MKSKEKILSDATDIPTVCGIYFLIKNNEIVYIGQSINIHHRITNHCRDKDFDKVSIIECNKASLDDLEKEYINKFQPIINLEGMKRQARKVKFFDKLGISG
jgi:excinuclease UvrABC nuclease subunit